MSGYNPGDPSGAPSPASRRLSADLHRDVMRLLMRDTEEETDSSRQQQQQQQLLLLLLQQQQQQQQTWLQMSGDPQLHQLHPSQAALLPLHKEECALLWLAGPQQQQQQQQQGQLTFLQQGQPEEWEAQWLQQQMLKQQQTQQHQQQQLCGPAKYWQGEQQLSGTERQEDASHSKLLPTSSLQELEETEGSSNSNSSSNSSSDNSSSASSNGNAFVLRIAPMQQHALQQISSSEMRRTPCLEQRSSSSSSSSGSNRGPLLPRSSSVLRSSVGRARGPGETSRLSAAAAAASAGRKSMQQGVQQRCLCRSSLTRPFKPSRTAAAEEAAAAAGAAAARAKDRLSLLSQGARRPQQQQQQQHQQQQQQLLRRSPERVVHSVLPLQGGEEKYMLLQGDTSLRGGTQLRPLKGKRQVRLEPEKSLSFRSSSAGRMQRLGAAAAVYRQPKAAVVGRERKYFVSSSELYVHDGDTRPATPPVASYSDSTTYTHRNSSSSSSGSGSGSGFVPLGHIPVSTKSVRPPPLSRYSCATHTQAAPTAAAAKHAAPVAAAAAAKRSSAAAAAAAKAAATAAAGKSNSFKAKSAAFLHKDKKRRPLFVDEPLYQEEFVVAFDEWKTLRGWTSWVENPDPISWFFDLRWLSPASSLLVAYEKQKAQVYRHLPGASTSAFAVSPAPFVVTQTLNPRTESEKDKWDSNLDDLYFGKLQSFQIVNRFVNSQPLTTKHGLLETLRSNLCFFGGGSPDPFFPRSYHLNNPTDKHTFISDFKLTRAAAVLKLQVLQWACGFVGWGETEMLSLGLLETRLRDRIETFSSAANKATGNEKWRHCFSREWMDCSSARDSCIGDAEAGSRGSTRRMTYLALLRKGLKPEAVRAAAAAVRRHLALTGRQTPLIDCPFIGDEEWSLVQSVPLRGLSAVEVVMPSFSPEVLTSMCLRWSRKQRELQQQAAQSGEGACEGGEEREGDKATSIEKAAADPLTLRAASCLFDLSKKNPHTWQDGWSSVWLLKAADLSRGRCIDLFDSLPVEVRPSEPRREKFRAQGGDTLRKERQDISNRGSYVPQQVAQKYIERPLLIHGKKCDLRLWVLVTSWNPLKVWIYRKCYLRFGVEPYDFKNINNKRYGSEFRVSVARLRGNVWTNEQFSDFLFSTFGSRLWEKNIYPDICRIVKLVCMSAQGEIEAKGQAHELFGFDLLVDEDCNAWLLEVNASPDLSYSNPTTEALVKRLLPDILKVILGPANKEAEGDFGDFELLHIGKVNF
ncbi:hypothetical protein Esti_001694 [Eimeria stiedai]